MCDKDKELCAKEQAARTHPGDDKEKSQQRTVEEAFRQTRLSECRPDPVSNKVSNGYHQYGDKKVFRNHFPGFYTSLSRINVTGNTQYGQPVSDAYNNRSSQFLEQKNRHKKCQRKNKLGRKRGDC